MSRYRNYTRFDDPAQTVGDLGFLGVDCKREPSVLKPGLCSWSENNRFVTGAAATRGGMVAPLFAQPTEPIFGSGIYSDPDGTEWLMQARATSVVLTRNGRTPITIALPADVTLSASCELVQCFAQVILFRGTSPLVDLSPLSWSGDFADDFVPIIPSETGTGTESIPAAVTGEVFGDQLVIPINRDELIFSDRLDFTHFDPVFSQAKISKGTDEEIVRILPYTRSSILIFKTASIYALTNLVGSFAENAQLEEVNRNLGCFARRSVAMVGGDAFFLSSTGIYRVQQVIQDRIQTAAVPVSEPIDPIIKRINWQYAADAVGVVFGAFYYLAVPLDSSTVNNAILVFDTTSNQWQGIDSTEFALAVGDFRVHDFQGAKRLFAMDYVNSRVFVMEEGLSDVIGNTNYPIATRLDTRGYAVEDPTTLKRFTAVKAALGTWWPTYTITAVAPGINEVQPLALAVAKSRLRFDLFGKPDFDPTEAPSASNDPTAPRRQDYSVDLTGGVYLDGLTGEGTQLDLQQDHLERNPVRPSGARWLQIRITNTRGTIAVHAITLEGINNAQNNLRATV